MSALRCTLTQWFCFAAGLLLVQSVSVGTANAGLNLPPGQAGSLDNCVAESRACDSLAWVNFSSPCVIDGWTTLCACYKHNPTYAAAVDKCDNAYTDCVNRIGIQPGWYDYSLRPDFLERVTCSPLIGPLYVSDTDYLSGAQVKVVWSDTTTNTPTLYPSTVDNVGFYVVRAATFDSSWAVSPTLVDVPFEFIGYGTADPLPGTARAEKAGVCSAFGYSITLPTGLEADSVYELAAVATYVSSSDTAVDLIMHYMQISSSSLGVPGSSGPGAGISLEIRPNPTSGDANIAFKLPTAERATVAVFDLAGRRLETLEDGVLSAGGHRVSWSGQEEQGGLATDGMYFVRVYTDAGSATRPILLVR